MSSHPMDPSIGEEMHGWMRDLWSVPRSLTGNGVRQTLGYLAELLPGLETHELPTGTKVLDWIVPDEWNIRRARIEELDGPVAVDFADSNLHVVGYSTPIDAIVSRAELEPHLYSLPDQPDAIPYVTSYYRKDWGFCLSHRVREGLGDGPFRVVIDATLAPGALSYADCVILGETEDEVLLSTYVCHPAMANNELSGPVVLTAIGRWLQSLPTRRLTYRLVYVPETIGSIAYIARHGDALRKRVIAGWAATCMGDERAYSYVPSRLGGTIADRASLAVLRTRENVMKYTFLDRGSDERQWCSPGVDLPVCSVMRSKYGTYPEHHTSLDDLSLVTPAGLAGGLAVLQECILLIDDRRRWIATQQGEPQLGRRGLYPTISYRGSADNMRDLMNILAYCDGEHTVLDLVERLELEHSAVTSIIDTLVSADLVRPVDES